MKIDKRSNIYTVIYVTVIVLIVGTALAFTSLSLRERQQTNVAADKMRQILASARIQAGDGDNIIHNFREHIVDQPVYDSSGARVGDNAFDIDVAAQSGLKPDDRQLPLFVCQTDDGMIKYIIPLYGAGLWGPIWGYVSLDADGSTVYGAYFDHQSETPGLGAEISKREFSDQFAGKQMWKNGEFLPVSVVKKGMKPIGNEDYVDGISGGTITSKGVGAMLGDCLSPYKTILKKLRQEKQQ